MQGRGGVVGRLECRHEWGFVMPLSHCNVLIVEDELLTALDLVTAVEDASGRLIGPAATVGAALAIIDTEVIHAAVLDAHLSDGDITPVAEALTARGVPFVVYTGIGLPHGLRHRDDIPVFIKPVPVSRLIAEVAALVPRMPWVPASGDVPVMIAAE